jgi:serine/threonine-protein kinase HipA
VTVTTLAEVRLWGRRIGAVALEDGNDTAAFEFEPDFVRSGIQVSPLTMPLSRRVYSFPGLSRETFYGLPGLLADSLPDKFGNALIDAWLATRGRLPGSFNAVERLCYTGNRGMGALEFAPIAGPRARKASRIRIDQLVALASDILTRRNDLRRSFADEEKARALTDILRVGTSAGGTGTVTKCVPGRFRPVKGLSTGC